MAVGDLIELNDTVVYQFRVTTTTQTLSNQGTMLIFAPAFRITYSTPKVCKIYRFKANQGNGNSPNAWYLFDRSQQTGAFTHNTSVNSTDRTEIHVWKLIYDCSGGSIQFILYGMNGMGIDDIDTSNEGQILQRWSGQPIRAMNVKAWKIASGETYTSISECINEQAPVVQRGKPILWSYGSIANRVSNWTGTRVTLCAHQEMPYITSLGNVDNTPYVDETPTGHEHVWGNYVVTKAATCTEDGTQTATCSECGETDIQTINKLGHSMTYHAAVSKTCTKNGNSAYYSCSNCNKYFSDTNGNTEIAADSWVIPKGHTLTEHPAVAATCTEKGNIKYYSCSVCGNYYKYGNGTGQIHKGDEKTPALGHDYDGRGICRRCGATSGGCFVKGTKVMLPDRFTKNIEDCQVGEEVLAYDIETNTLQPTIIVTNTIYCTKEPLIKITFVNGDQLICTEEHPLYSKRGWVSYNPSLSQHNHQVECQLINISDCILNNNLKYIAIAQIEHVDQDPRHLVYNLGTQTYHTFIANNYIAHNTEVKGAL